MSTQRRRSRQTTPRPPRTAALYSYGADITRIYGTESTSFFPLLVTLRLEGVPVDLFLAFFFERRYNLSARFTGAKDLVVVRVTRRRLLERERRVGKM